MLELTAFSARPDALPVRDYSLALLNRCAADGALSPERLEAIRAALHAAAAERARAYSRGRSMVVSRSQAEAFYAAVFCQLDAVLLPLADDEQAAEILRTQPLDRLLEHGQQQTLAMFAQAKEDFRRAYKLTAVFPNSFFRETLKGFERFCTAYDARFHADVPAEIFSYPLAGDAERERPNGVPGVSLYYRCLLLEGEFLSRFDRDALQRTFTRYAALYLTTADMLAENLAELALRHMLAAMLAGGEPFSAALTEAAFTRLYDLYEMQTPAQLEQACERELLRCALPETMALHLRGALPRLAKGLHARITDRCLGGWLAKMEE